MSDTSEYWADVKAYYRNRKPYRQANEKMAIKKLEESGIPFTRFDQHHFRVAGCFDYWPSTGLWIEKKTGLKGRGINDLFEKIESISTQRPTAP